MAKPWTSDDELFAIAQREPFTCVVGDVMDKLNLRHQFLPPQIRPLHPDMMLIKRWTQAHIPGHLVFTSSYVARMPHTQISAYAAAKAALENFARSLALEYALIGIRVNVVSPGDVAAGSSLKVCEEDSAYREFVLRVSLGRRNTPESIADAFVFLCSTLANEINGQVLSPDYGGGIGNRL